MDQNNSLKEYIETAEYLLLKNQLDKYIRYAKFPHYKNFSKNTEINFDFPITAIIGPNGAGKSSILYAIYGMPLRSSTSRFWFSTTLDPIAESQGEGPNRYYYSHYVHDIKEWVETKKVRGRKNESYWEPARVSTKDGMAAMPEKTPAKHKPHRSKDRWSATSRQVVYISFKYQFSAFDKAFHISSKNRTLSERINTIKIGASKLNKIVNKNLSSYKPGGHQSLYTHETLSQQKLSWINHILGKNYKNARIIEHRLYDKEIGTSIIFETENEKYSEAFAGSGELAVVNLVSKIIDSKNNCLILLDEPETSLHPGAQENLIRFLLWSIVEKKTQVVLCTHSTQIAELLPEKALKTLIEAENGKIDIRDVEHKQMAFNRIGYIQENKKLFIVEDSLLTTIVDNALKKIDNWKTEAVNIQTPQNGAEDILKYHIPRFIEDKIDAYVFLDGDKKISDEFRNLDYETLSSQELYRKIKNELSCDPLYLSKDKKDLSIEYIEWIKNRVYYLNEICPEVVFLKLLELDFDEKITNQQAKEKLGKYLSSNNLANSASQIKTLFNLYLWQGGDIDCVDRIAEAIDNIFKAGPA